MAEEKKAKKETKVKKEKSEKKNHDFSGKTVSELKTELQTLLLDIRTGKEKNTSLVKKLKKSIAKIKTSENKNN